MVALAVTAFVAGPATLAGAAGQPVGTITNFSTAGLDPSGITAGPDGNLWFTNAEHNSIGRITPSGSVATFAGVGISEPRGITTGPDGNLWFTNSGNNSIGRITLTGVVTNYTGVGISLPLAITTGPDGNLWFTNSGNNSIGRITPTGTVKKYTGIGISDPVAITAGPDGNLWFTNQGTASIGRITPTGTVAKFTGPGISDPLGITTGPDGNLWVTNSNTNSIGRITPAGTGTNFTGPGISSPRWIVTGPDGNLWFTKYGNNSIGRITPTGRATTFTSTGISDPYRITAGPDGNVWFTNLGNDLIGRIWTVPPSFSDVPAGHPFVTEIGWLASTGITTGYPDGTFRPSSPVTRQAIASFLYKYEDQPVSTLTEPFFADVPDTHPFYPAVQWMAESGLSTGSSQPAGKPLFKPADLVSRQALATFLWRNADEPSSGLSSAFFADVTSGSPFYAPVQWMAETGLSTGTPAPPGKPLYKPLNPVTRQAIAAFLYRYDRL